MKESQQASQGVTIGTQGNQGGAVTESAQAGRHRKNNSGDDRQIPNQDMSSPTNQDPDKQERERYPAGKAIPVDQHH